MQLYVRTSTSANCLPLPYGVIALSCDENVEARLSDPSVIVLNPVREWLSELCCNCERGTAAIRLVTSSSAVEKAVSGCDDVDLEVVAANLVDRAAEILGRKVRASYDRHVVYNDRCSTYERAVYSLVAAAEISFLRSLYTNNVLCENYAKKNIKQFQAWRDLWLGQLTGGMSTLLCLSAIAGHQPSANVLKQAGPTAPKKLLNGAFDAMRLEELNASALKRNKMGERADIAIFITLDKNLAESFSRYGIHGTNLDRYVGVSVILPWLSENMRKETKHWYVNLPPRATHDPCRARNALLAIEKTYPDTVPEKIYSLASALDRFAMHSLFPISHINTNGLSRRYCIFKPV
jgi:hypothetical protein